MSAAVKNEFGVFCVCKVSPVRPAACVSLHKSFIFRLLRVSGVLADYGRLTECEEALKSIGLLGTSEEIIFPPASVSGKNQTQRTEHSLKVRLIFHVDKGIKQEGSSTPGWGSSCCCCGSLNCWFSLVSLHFTSPLLSFSSSL